MKKFLVVLLALVAVAGAFAQTPALTFGLYGDATVTVAGTDSYAVYTETYLTYKAKDMGLNATVIAQTDKVWDPADGKRLNPAFDIFATPRNYKFWYQVCSAAKISVGVLRETGSARLTSVIEGNGFSTRMANVETGVLAEMNVVKGLTLAVFAPVSAVAPIDNLKNSAVGVSFALPNVASIVGAYKFVNKELSVGLDLKAVKDTTIKAGLKNTGSFGAATVLYGTFGKTMGALSVAVDADFVVKPAAAYGIEGRVEYTMGSYVLGARVWSDNGDAWFNNKNLVLKGYLKRNFAAGDIITGVKYNAGTAVVSMPVDFEISF